DRLIGRVDLDVVEVHEAAVHLLLVAAHGRRVHLVVALVEVDRKAHDRRAWRERRDHLRVTAPAVTACPRTLLVLRCVAAHECGPKPAGCSVNVPATADAGTNSASAATAQADAVKRLIKTSPDNARTPTVARGSPVVWVLPSRQARQAWPRGHNRGPFGLGRT